MTFETTALRTAFNGDDNTTEFSVTWEIVSTSSLELYLVESDGTVTALVEDTDYTITAADPGPGADIVYPYDDEVGPAPSPMATGDKLLVIRRSTLTQDKNIGTSGTGWRTTTEAALDEIVAMVQELDEQVSRSIRLADTDTGTVPTMSLPASGRAGKAVIFDDDGNIDVSTDDYEDQAAAAAASADAAAASAAEAAADAIATAADVVSTNADAAATAADVISTNADAASTAADVISTNADAASTAQDAIDTAADVVSSGNNVTYAEEWANKAEDSLVSAAAGGNESDEYSALHWAAKAAADAVLTAADVVSTNADVVSTNADAAATAQDAIDTAADVVTTGNNVTYAEEWAVKAEDSAVSVAAGGDGSTTFSALHWAAKAAASAASIGFSLNDGGTGTDEVWSGSYLTTQFGAIDHDALTNYVANEHIDWTNTTSVLTTTGFINASGVNVIPTSGTADAYFQIGQNRAGNGYSYFDLVSDATYTDFALRLIRGNTGPNATSELIHRGTGNLSITTQDAAAFVVKTTNVARLTISADGNTVTLEDPAAWQTGLGLVIGTNVQAQNAWLTTLAGYANAATTFSNIKQAATTTATGVVEKSTSGENVAGTSDTVYPSVAGVKEMIDTHAAGGATLSAAMLYYDLAKGTNGPGFTTGAWRTVQFDQEIDPDSIVSITSNQFRFASTGTYLLLFDCNWKGNDGPAHIRCHNVDAAADVAPHTNWYAGGNANVAAHAWVVVVTNATHDYEIQVYPKTNNIEANNNANVNDPTGYVEIYHRMAILKVA